MGVPVTLISGGVDRNTKRAVQRRASRWASISGEARKAVANNRGDDATRRELSNSLVIRICNEQVPGGVDRNTDDPPGDPVLNTVIADLRHLAEQSEPDPISVTASPARKPGDPVISMVVRSIEIVPRMFVSRPSAITLPRFERRWKMPSA